MGTQVINVAGFISSQPKQSHLRLRMKLLILLGLTGYFLASSGGNPSPLESINREEQTTTSDPSVCGYGQCEWDEDCDELYLSCEEGICKHIPITSDPNCEPYSVQACKNAGARVGRIFSQGDWFYKGCYIYIDGSYLGDIFYGTNGTDVQEEISSKLDSTLVARPFGFDCKGDGCVDTDCGKTDADGYSCAMGYTEVDDLKYDCGQYDDDDFEAKSMCCRCKYL